MYQERIGRVLAAMEQMGLEQMIVSDLVSHRVLRISL